MLKNKALFTIMLMGLFSMLLINSNLSAQEQTVVEILNPGYMKAPNENNNVEITEESTLEDILNKIDYFYAKHDFDEAIKLCEYVLDRTDNEQLAAIINYSLSANYLEKGIQEYITNKDDSFYQLSIQYAKKALEVFPDNWQALGNIGNVYLNMGDYDQAINYYIEAQKYLDRADPNYASIDQHLKIAEEMSDEQ